MADPAPPSGFAVDNEAAPPPGFTLDESPQPSAQPDQPLYQATDAEKAAIIDYSGKAKDAADLAQYAKELTNGKVNIGNAQQIIDQRDKAHGNVRFVWQEPTAAPSQPAPEEAPNKFSDAILKGLDRMFPGLGSFFRTPAGQAFANHAANAAAFDYGPEIGGFAKTALDPSQYGDFSANLDRNVAHGHAILTGETSAHPLASTAGELTGVTIPAMVGDAAGLANAPRLARGAAAAGEGAAYGSGAAGPDNRAEGAAIGAALGAGTEAAVGTLAARSAAKTAAESANQDFAQAAGRQGIDYMAADLPNATKSKFATALSKITFGAIPLAEQGGKNVASASAAADRVAGNIGSVADRTGAGQAAQSGARQFLDTTQQKMSALYDAIPIDHSAPAVVSNTRSALNGLDQAFQSNPKLAQAFRDPKIAAYLDALTPKTTQEATGVLDASGNPIMRDVTHDGNLSWGDLKDFRTRVGQVIGQPGLTSDGQQIGALRSLYGALSDDMQATAGQSGSQALNAFNRANTYARARNDRINNVVSLILGPDENRAPQSAFEALQRLANEKGGDPLKLARALRSMPDDEANSVRATMLDELGNASAGQQNAAGTAFSPAQFVTNWNKLSDRSKNILFTGEHRTAINDLVNVFSGMKASSQFANTSKTGIAIAAAHTATLSLAHPVLGALDIALQYGGGKLLASPSFARKIAATPMNIAGARAFWSRPWVQAMQAKNPAIAGEIRAFQSAFLSHANDNMVSAAAASPDPEQQDQQQ